MSVMEETLVMEIVFADDAELPANTDPASYLENEAEVLSHNIEAMKVDVDALNAFLELLAACDAEYIDTQADAGDYPVGSPRPMLDWDSVSAALDESQRLLIGVQQSCFPRRSRRWGWRITTASASIPTERASCIFSSTIRTRRKSRRR